MTNFLPLTRPDTRTVEERVIHEFRFSRPVLFLHRGHRILAAPLDGIDLALFEGIATRPDGSLTLSQEKTHALGIEDKAELSFALTAVGLPAARRLAFSRYRGKLPAHSPAPTAVKLAQAFCKAAGLPPAVISTRIYAGDRLSRDLLRYDAWNGATQPDALSEVEEVAKARVPLPCDVEARMVAFRQRGGMREHLAVIVGQPDPRKPVPVRIHSSCLTGDVFGSLKCDCGDQLQQALHHLESASGGVLIYLDQEGRGIGLSNKLRAYALQEAGLDTIDADEALGFDSDERRFDVAAAILRALGYRCILLLTNNPAKSEAMKAAGIMIAGTLSLAGRVTRHNRRYLETKVLRAGHTLDFMSLSSDPSSP